MSPLFGMTMLVWMSAELEPPFTAVRFKTHAAYIASDELAGRAVGSEGSRLALTYMVNALRDSGCVGLAGRDEWLQSFPVPSRSNRGDRESSLTAHNLLALFPGKGELREHAIIVSTHHDHFGVDSQLVAAGKDGIYNGADDNASGCAALLLIAEALHRDRDDLPASHRAIVFASFDAEEQGLLGSRFYVEHPLWPLARTTANINLDMVGRMEHARVFAIDGLSSAFFAKRTLELARSCGLRCDAHLNGTRRSDHMNFLDREIPAVHFCTGIHIDYHQPTDETTKLNHAGGARVSWLAYRLLLEAMKTAEPLRYQRPDPRLDVSSLIRLAAKMGLIPELNTQTGRYPLIRAVFPGSIAANNGFQADDEILAINGKSFDRVEQAAALLAEIRFDRDLHFQIRRNGTTRQLTLPAEALKDFAGPVVRPLDRDRYEVHFRFRDGKPHTAIAVAGTFNQWNKSSVPMTGPDPNGWYTVKLVLAKGEYEYKFVLDGELWTNDPTNVYLVGPNANNWLRVGDDS
jgi:hypothetical protein